MGPTIENCLQGTTEKATHPLSVGLALLLMACPSLGCSKGDQCDPLDTVEQARAIDATHVEVKLTCAPKLSMEQIDIEAFSGKNDESLALMAISGEKSFVIETSPQVGLRQYTLRISSLEAPNGTTFTASANFIGVGDIDKSQVQFVVDDRYDQQLPAVFVRVSADPETGVFLPKPWTLALTDEDNDHIFSAKLDVAIDPLRTLNESDDRLGQERLAYHAIAVDENGQSLSSLVQFEVRDDKAVEVKLPLLSVPPPPRPEGLISVDLRIDDTAANALTNPALRVSIDEDGTFDPSFPTTIPIYDEDGDSIYEATIRVRIDPARVFGGSTTTDFPYVVYLANEGIDYPGTGTEVIAPDESSQEAKIQVGNPNLVPVTFRVDVSSTFLNASGSQRGVSQNESVYLTGEFGTAEDAFGQNASDAFTGGENVVLQMAEMDRFPGVWERTLFLPPNRPYGWKVVRCPTDVGCSDVNRKVTSSGRAFPTVMKNLVTENRDAQTASNVRVFDPRFPLVTFDDGTRLDYSQAQVFIGSQMGSEPNPPGLPDGQRLFKQELPDLVVDVKTEAVQTPVIVVGTWRDVNLPMTLAEIINSDQVFDLGPTDYDAGFVGAAAPAYELPEPPKPPSFVLGDGTIDEMAIDLAGGSPSSMNLSAAIHEGLLYVATEDAGEGSDHMIFVAAEEPQAPLPAPWGKRGSVAMSAEAIFLADENDSTFSGWFRLGTAALLGDGMATGPAMSAAGGGVLEGTVDLEAIFGSVPTTLYFAVVPYDTGDSGVLYHEGQFPMSVNSDSNIDADEVARIPSSELELSQ